MTNDIVARLRVWSADESTWDLLTEAADEIETLREKMKNIIEWCDKLLSHKPMPKPFADAIKEGRAALEGGKTDE
jgi:hypothetical protein